MKTTTFAIVLVLLLWGTAGEALSGGRSDRPARDAAANTAWAPPDIDAVIPAVDTATPCPVHDVVQSTADQVRKFVTDMQRFSAREKLEYSEFDHSGRQRSIHTVSFTYVADIHELRPGQLTVDEYRDDLVGTESFPGRLATTGLAAFALIFHPDYVNDFEVTCEGLANLHGRPAWQLHFAQRRPDNFRGYRTSTGYYPVELKGRAWVAQDTFQVLRLETDLLEPIPAIRLKREHVDIEYGPVSFPRHGVVLWLPQTATIYMDYQGQRYCHRHSFSGFQLFWVDTQQSTKAPKAEPAAPGVDQ